MHNYGLSFASEREINYKKPMTLTTDNGDKYTVSRINESVLITPDKKKMRGKR